MQDIENQQDIENIMRNFYGKLLDDPLMSPHFAQTDFEHHLPRIIGFWAFVLLDEPMQSSNIFDTHRHLKIDKRHFDVWIQTFCETVDAHFAGTKAEKAKQNARVIGFTFQSKLAFLNPSTD